AHELAHVVQQARTDGFTASDESAEADAEHAEAEFHQGVTASVRERAAPGVQSRADLPTAAEAEARRAAEHARNTYEEPTAHRIICAWERTGLPERRAPGAGPAGARPEPHPSRPVAPRAEAMVAQAPAAQAPAAQPPTAQAPAAIPAPGTPQAAGGMHGPFSRLGGAIPIAPPDDPLEEQAVHGHPAHGPVAPRSLGSVDARTAELLRGIAGDGTSLPVSLRSAAESRLGALPDVRIYTDVAAVAALRARAFAYGKGIFLAPG